MKKTGKTSQQISSIPTGNGIDAACRVPLFFLVLGSIFWLLTGTVLDATFSLQWFGFFSQPRFGQLFAIRDIIFQYGFAVQMALAIFVWILCNNEETSRFSNYVVISTIFWNLGILTGIISIFSGDATGIDGFPLSCSSAFILLTATLPIIWCGLTPYFKGCIKRQHAIPTLFAAAGILWFAWIHITAILLLFITPVRGILQANLGWWHWHNLNGIVLAFSGLAVLVQLISSHSFQAQRFKMQGFWLLALLGGLGGMAFDAPLPAWITSISTAGTVLMLFPSVLIAYQFCQALQKARFETGDNTLKFALTSLFLWILSECLLSVSALPSVNSLLHFTSFDTANQRLLLNGFFLLATISALHEIWPKLCGVKWLSKRRIAASFWFVTSGTLIIWIVNATAGITEGLLLKSTTQSFHDVLFNVLPVLKFELLGKLLVLIGLGLFTCDLFRLYYKRAAYTTVQKPVTSTSETVKQTPDLQNSALLFLTGAFLVMSISWMGLILFPTLQLGQMEPSAVIGDETQTYPNARSGLALKGADLYRNSGCVACHTQQIRPSTLGYDIAHGWGTRRSVPRDYLFDEPPMPGSHRVGPDLANIGVRLTSAQITERLRDSLKSHSIMPSCQFLFSNPSDSATVALNDNGLALLAYLQSLKSTAILYETPTNTPSK